MQEESKVCTKCYATKKLSLYHKSGKFPDGMVRYSSSCAACRNKAKKELKIFLSTLHLPPRPPTKDGYKVCSRCNIERALSEFYTNGMSSTGSIYRRSICKCCDSDKVKKNPAHANAKAAKRRAIQKKATPVWYYSDIKDIQNIYLASTKVSRETGIVHNVDHIIPLQSELVCGLHCSNNLEVITRVDNHIKFNTKWPDMWDYGVYKEETLNLLTTNIKVKY